MLYLKKSCPKGKKKEEGVSARASLGGHCGETELHSEQENSMENQVTARLDVPGVSDTATQHVRKQLRLHLAADRAGLVSKKIADGARASSTVALPYSKRPESEMLHPHDTPNGKSHTGFLC